MRAPWSLLALLAACGPAPAGPAAPPAVVLIELPPPAPAPAPTPPPSAAIPPDALAPAPSPAADAPVLTLDDGPAGTWTGQHGNLEHPIMHVWGAGEDAYAVAGRSLIHSNDRGLTWWPVTIPTDAHVASVWGAGPDDVYVGSRGTAFRSTDRGRTWTRLRMPAPVHYNAFWGDEKDLWVVGSEGTVGHSSDHGATWDRQAKDLQLGWLYAVWGHGKDVWVAGEGGASSAALIHTANGGKTWTAVNIQASPLRGICGTGDGSLYAIDARGSVHGSVDHGKTWKELKSFGGLELTALACNGKSEVYVGGRNRTFQRSADGGKTWVDDLAAQNKWTKVAFSAVYALWVVPGGAVYAGGEGVYSPHPTGTLFRRR